MSTFKKYYFVSITIFLVYSKNIFPQNFKTIFIKYKL